MKNIKKIIVFFLFIIFLNNYGYDQNSFIWNLDSSYVFNYMIEKETGQYYFAGYIDNNPQPLKYDSAILLKWSYNKDSIVKVVTKDTNYNNVAFYLMIPHSTNGFVAIGTLGYRHNSDTNAIWLAGYDSLLNQLWEVEYPLARKYIFFRTPRKLKNNNWLIPLTTYNPQWVVHDQYYLMEITENGAIEHLIPADTCALLDDIAIHPVTGNIYCMGDYIYPHNPSITWINIYDSNYNLVTHKPVFPNDINYSLNYPFGGEWMNADTFLFSTRKSYKNSTIQDEDICLFYMKETDSIFPLKESCFRRPNTKDYTVWKSFDITANQQIIQIGILDLIDLEKTWIGCYDKQLNLLYHRIFVSTDMQNNPNAVFHTTDSGYIVINAKATSFFNPYDLIIQVLKFDKNGNLPGLEVASNIKIERHLVYPNPGKDYFIMELSRELLDKGQCIVELYNINGGLQNQWTFEGNQVQIIADNIPEGLYFYRVIQNNKSIVTGKWMKIN